MTELAQLSSNFIAKVALFVEVEVVSFKVQVK